MMPATVQVCDGFCHALFGDGTGMRYLEVYREAWSVGEVCCLCAAKYTGQGD